jgi:hypothetical protein
MPSTTRPLPLSHLLKSLKSTRLIHNPNPIYNSYHNSSLYRSYSFKPGMLSTQPLTISHPFTTFSTLPPTLHKPLIPLILLTSQLQLQAWNAIDDTTPTQMITKTALNLFWYIYLARHFSNLMKEYIQIMKEYLSKLKEIEMEGKNNYMYTYMYVISSLIIILLTIQTQQYVLISAFIC